MKIKAKCDVCQRRAKARMIRLGFTLCKKHFDMKEKNAISKNA